MSRALLALAALLIGIGVGMLPSSPPPAEAPPGEVLRRLQIRLDAPLDAAGRRGDRYRLFECREIPREEKKS